MPKRAELITGAADVMAVGRGDALAVMSSEAGKTVDEADPEISEGIDYARWYGTGQGLSSGCWRTWTEKRRANRSAS